MFIVILGKISGGPVFDLGNLFFGVLAVDRLIWPYYVKWKIWTKCLKMLNLKMVTNATIHKLLKIDFLDYHYKSLPVASRASLPGHRQCLHLCFSCREYAFCFVLFFLFCFSVLFISCILPHFVISAPAARSS